jgi:inosine-uridine nucleoside N-ribohydrolase
MVSKLNLFSSLTSNVPMDQSSSSGFWHRSMSSELLVRGTRILPKILLLLNLLLQTIVADASDDRKNVWVDTDLACGSGRAVDVDDCLALTYLLLRPEIRIVAISTVFGNMEEPVVFDRLTRFLQHFHSSYPNIKIPKIVRGAISRKNRYGQSPSSPASIGMINFFTKNKGEIYLLGPSTNLATAYSVDPAIENNIGRVLFVAGKQGSGRRFFPDEGSRLMSFRDFNLAKDTYSFASLFESRLSFHIAGYDLASGLKFNESSLKALNLKEPLHSYLAANIVSWSQYWEEMFGIKGFYPFDLVAVKSVLDPELFNCVETTAILNTSNFFVF